jgi:hypothetical protein
MLCRNGLLVIKEQGQRTPIKRPTKPSKRETPSFFAHDPTVTWQIPHSYSQHHLTRTTTPRPHSDLADPPLVLTTPSHTHNHASSSDILLTLEYVYVYV